MTEAVLYDYWRSSASYRLRIALNLAGIVYESRVVDLVAGDQRSPDHLALNPQGFVPVLEIDLAGDGLQVQDLGVTDEQHGDLVDVR